MKQGNQGYEDRYKEVEVEILCNIKKYEPYLDRDYEELQNFDFVQSDEEDNTEFSIINPNLLDGDLEGSDSVSNAPVVSTVIDYLSLPNEQFYEICSQLNEVQQHLFNFIMQFALHCKLAEKNNEFPPKPFQMFLTGKSVPDIGKSFLIKAITKYLKRVLRYLNQNLDQSSVLLTASTGITATGINRITLHSGFHLPVKSGLKSTSIKSQITKPFIC